jgi:hypothetical protein
VPILYAVTNTNNLKAEDIYTEYSNEAWVLPRSTFRHVTVLELATYKIFYAESFGGYSLPL